MRHEVIMLGVLALCGALACAQPSPAQDACPKGKADQARQAAGGMKAWGDVFNFYKEFQACDDGDIAEGVSDALEPILMDKWNSLAEVNSFVVQDAKFETFFLRHVGEAFSEDSANEVIRRCGAACPAGAERLCESIANTLKQ